MTLYHFNLLKGPEQWQALWERGIHIGERFSQGHHVLLYQVEGFYVEVYYNMDNNSLHRLRSFKSTDQLTPYLRKISIVELL